MRNALILIPTPLAEGALHTLPAEVYTHTQTLRHYFAENARTCRRFLRSLHPTLKLEEIEISEIDKHAGADIKLLTTWLKVGHNVGVVSEAGCPVIADPGSLLVYHAHKLGTPIVPLTGPSSIILAVMASGLSGQNFAFNGYLPLKEPARGKRIKELETRSQLEQQAQVFIETPYRNNTLLADLLKHCQPYTRISIAANLTAPNQFTTTRTVIDWKKSTPTLEKVPAVFILSAAK